MAQFVIIGGGIGGTIAAETLRKRDADAEITLIGNEVHPVYSRVLLANYIEGKTERDRLFLKSPDWYIENNITYMSGIEAVKVDTKNKFVRTTEDREIPYDALLITSGAEVRLMNQDMRGVLYFRTLEDAENIMSTVKATMLRPENERNAVVLGGGFIALEFINIFHHFKLPTTVVLRSSGFWSKSLGEHAQKILERHAEKQGVKLVTNQSSTELVGNEDVEGVKLDDGSMLPASIVGVGIGMIPEFGFLKDSGVETNKGILVNEYLETNVPGVYAAGDVAEFYHKVIDRQFVLGNWTNAQMQARAAAASMTGERSAFELVSSYSANLLGKDIVFVGDTSREHADEIIQHAADEENSIEIFVRNGKIVGTVLIGDVAERTKFTNKIQNQEPYVR